MPSGASDDNYSLNAMNLGPYTGILNPNPTLGSADARRLAQAYVNLATLYTHQERLDLALATIEGALGLLPESTQLIDALAEIHSRYAVLYKEVARRQRASERTA